MESTTTGIVLAVVFVGLHVGEAVFQHYWVDKKTVPVGAFLALLAIVAGFEWRSVTGGFVALVFVAFAVALGEELAPDGRESEVSSGAPEAEAVPI